MNGILSLIGQMNPFAGAGGQNAEKKKMQSARRAISALPPGRADKTKRSYVKNQNKFKAMQKKIVEINNEKKQLENGLMVMGVAKVALGILVVVGACAYAAHRYDPTLVTTLTAKFPNQVELLSNGTQMALSGLNTGKDFLINKAINVRDFCISHLSSLEEMGKGILISQKQNIENRTTLQRVIEFCSNNKEQCEAMPENLKAALRAFV